MTNFLTITLFKALIFTSNSSSLYFCQQTFTTSTFPKITTINNLNNLPHDRDTLDDRHSDLAPNGLLGCVCARLQQLLAVGSQRGLRGREELAGQSTESEDAVREAPIKSTAVKVLRGRRGFQ